MKSGLWVYDPEVGLYHKATPSTDKMVSDGTFTVSGETLTTSAPNNLKTGDGVQFTFVSGIGGIKNQTIYYVTVTGTNTIKLSYSRNLVKLGEYVALSGTVTTDTLIYFPNTDNGEQLTATSGAITRTTWNETPLNLLSSEVIWGNRTKNEAGTTVYTLSAFADMNSISSFTTQRVYSDNIEQTWKQITSFIDGVVTETDEIVVKVQQAHQSRRVELNGVWLSSNVINSNDAEQINGWAEIEEGDELVFIDGYGQGKTAHVTEIARSSGTFSITIDEPIGTASGQVDFYRTNFKKLGLLGVDEKQTEYLTHSIINGNNSPWIKIKLELRGAGIAVNWLDLSHEIHKGKG